jgi:thiamine-phosphate pyrophosphorylase
MSVPLGRLHVITDARPGRDPVPVVRAALSTSGPLVVQVRVPDEVPDRDAFRLAGRIVELCRAAGATCLVDDRLDVALAVGAHGGHVGARDLPVDAARRVLGAAAVLGATARDPVAARAAVAQGASYLGVGPVYPTATKTGLPPIGPAGIAAVAAAVDVPVIAIGGITRARVAEVIRAGAYGVAVVGAICAAPDPAAATAGLLAALADAHASAASAARP